MTRPADAAAEDHESLDVEAFLAAEATRQFCITWQAHGLHYGLPASAAEAYENGCVIVANVSRAALGHIATRFPALHIVEITAPRDVLVERLAGRGRESRVEIERRLERVVDLPYPPPGATCCRIDNSARAEDAAKILISAIRDPAGRSSS